MSKLSSPELLGYAGREATKITPRRLMVAGLLTFALASAGCRTEDVPPQSKETKTKVNQILRSAAQKNARRALRLQKQFPDEVTVNDTGKDVFVLAMIDKKVKLAGIGGFHDSMSLDITMEKVPGTDRPDPTRVTDINVQINMTDTNLSGVRSSHDSDISVWSPDSENPTWHAMYGGTESKKGKLIDSLSYGADTRYPAQESDAGFVHEAREAASFLDSQMKIFSDSLRDY